MANTSPDAYLDIEVQFLKGDAFSELDKLLKQYHEKIKKCYETLDQTTSKILQKTTTQIKELKKEHTSTFKEVKESGLKNYSEMIRGMKSQLKSFSEEEKKILSGTVSKNSPLKSYTRTYNINANENTKKIVGMFEENYKMKKLVSQANLSRKNTATRLDEAKIKYYETMINNPKSMQRGYSVLDRMITGAFYRVGGMIVSGIGQGQNSMEKDIYLRQAVIKSSRKGYTPSLSEYNKVSSEVGATTMFTSGQVARAMQFGASLGLDRTLATITKVSSQLAQATNTSIETTMDKVVRVTNAFQITDEKGVKLAMDKVLTATNNSAMDIEAMAKGVKYVGATAKASGISMDDTLALLGSLNNVGINASTSGTALNKFFLEISNAKKREKLESFIGNGFSVADKNGNIDAIGTLLALNQKLKGLKPSETMAITSELFGVRSGRVVNALATNDGSMAKLLELRNTISKGGGTIDKTNETIMGGVGGTYRKTVSLFQETFTNFVTTLAPTLIPIMEGLRSVVGFINKIITTYPMLTNLVGILGGSIFAKSLWNFATQRSSSLVENFKKILKTLLGLNVKEKVKSTKELFYEYSKVTGSQSQAIKLSRKNEGIIKTIKNHYRNMSKFAKRMTISGVIFGVLLFQYVRHVSQILNSSEELKNKWKETRKLLYGFVGGILNVFGAIFDVIFGINEKTSANATEQEKWKARLDAVNGVLKVIVDKLTGVSNWIRNNKGIAKFISIVVGIVYGLSIAIGVVNGALAIFNLALWSCPATWIIMAIIVGVTALATGIYMVWKHWDKVTDVMKRLWTWFKQTTFFKALYLEFEILKGIMNWVYEKIKIIGNAFITVGKAIGNAFHKVKSWLGGDSTKVSYTSGIQDEEIINKNLINQVKGVGSSVENTKKVTNHVTVTINEAKTPIETGHEVINQLKVYPMT